MSVLERQVWEDGFWIGYRKHMRTLVLNLPKAADRRHAEALFVQFGQYIVEVVNRFPVGMSDCQRGAMLSGNTEKPHKLLVDGCAVLLMIQKNIPTQVGNVILLGNTGGDGTGNGPAVDKIQWAMCDHL